MPAKKGTKRPKPDGVPQGKRGNKAKLKRMAKTAVMRECNALTRLKAALEAKEAAVDAKTETLAKMSKKSTEEKKEFAAQKQAFVREQTRFAKAKKAFETKVARHEKVTSSETVTPTNKALVAELENTKAELENSRAEHMEQFARYLGPRVKLADEEKIVEDSLKKLTFRQGEACSTQQSRCVLMLNFGLLQTGRTREDSVRLVAKTFRISEKKVYEVRSAWTEKGTLVESNGGSRGAVRSADDGRFRFNDDQRKTIHKFINCKHEQGRQVFRRDVCEFSAREFGISMSNRTVGDHLFRFGYRRRRGRIKISPFTEEGMNRIRRFCIEMDRAYRLEQMDEAVIVYMDESFVHQAHGSPYSYFQSDENGVVQDGFGRTSGKGLRVTMVHAITKNGPLVTFDKETGFPIEEGWFTDANVRAGRNAEGFKVTEAKTAEFIWKVKSAKGRLPFCYARSYDHGVLTYRLTPAFNALFGDKRMILVLDNAPYHHGFDLEVKVPESNTKMYNTGILCKYGVQKIRVTRKDKAGGGKGENEQFEILLEVPPAGSHFPRAGSKNGASMEEVAQAVRTHFERSDPTRLVERVEKFMQGKGWELIWTPPYMPSFQPIELFWQHGKHYVSFNYKTKRSVKELHGQIRAGFYGNNEWKGQEGGWKAANCRNLVRRAMDEANDWIEKRDPILSGKLGSLVIPDWYKQDDEHRDEVVESEGVEAELELEKFQGFESESPGDEDGDEEI